MTDLDTVRSTFKKKVFTVQINRVQVHRTQINFHQAISNLDSLRVYISVLEAQVVSIFINSPGDDTAIGNPFMPNKLIGH